MPTGGGSPGSRAVLAVVELTSGSIVDWDGTAIPFNSVTYDPHGLWTPAGKQFTIITPGWYRVSTAAPGSGGGIIAPAAAGTGSLYVTATVFGAGENLNVFVSNHTQVTSGAWFFPPVTGYTHLDAGDGVALLGQGGTGWQVGNGTQFAIELVA